MKLLLAPVCRPYSKPMIWTVMFGPIGGRAEMLQLAQADRGVPWTAGQYRFVDDDCELGRRAPLEDLLPAQTNVDGPADPFVADLGVGPGVAHRCGDLGVLAGLQQAGNDVDVVLRDGPRLLLHPDEESVGGCEVDLLPPLPPLALLGKCH